jgi:hypothetical protein
MVINAVVISWMLLLIRVTALMNMIAMLSRSLPCVQTKILKWKNTRLTYVHCEVISF